jgi:glycosyltransferase involved in cell wall biosynthesis
VPRSQLNRILATIAVDLTPVLPGGDNGGAKVFAIELLLHLAKLKPDSQFILLTQAASHDELAILERKNMRRVIVMSPPILSPNRVRLRDRGLRMLQWLPGGVRRRAMSWSGRLRAAVLRGNGNSLLRDMNVDLLFCPFTAPTYFEVGVPTVCTIHDLQYKTYPEFFVPADVAHRDRIFVDACLRATAVAAVSDYSRDAAITHGQIDGDSIRTIHHRIALRNTRDDDSSDDTLVRLGLTPGRFLLFPANFWKHKNHEMLLTAFGIARDRGLAKDIKLVCTGAPGARQDWLRSAARTMHLAESILFPGYLPNAGLATLMSKCTGVVFPSLYEGFGLPVVEAMAAGVPVACSNMTSLPEVTADAAILFDPRIPTQIADALLSMVGDETLRAHLIEAGTRRAEIFSDSDRMAREYWELFRYALANERQEHLLTGVYVDGWCGPILNIQVAPAASSQTLEVAFTAPKWLPHPKVTARAARGGKWVGTPLEMSRGSDGTMSLPVASTGAYYEIRLSPTFIPTRFGYDSDERELSAMLTRCVVIDHLSNRIEISK